MRYHCLEYLKYLFVCLIIALTMISCDRDEDRAIYFVGDSIIARWDLSESFPSRRVVNDGRSGAGIDYIESLSGKYVARTVVVMIGTNDSYFMTSETREEYALRYVRAIDALGASHVYLFSVLPRDFKGDLHDINSDIEAFNSIVKGLVASIRSITYIDAYDCFMHNGKIDSQLYSDGLHMSQYGYEVLTSLILEAL